MAKIKIYTKLGRTYAAIRPSEHSAWFGIPVSQARKALKSGRIDYGMGRDIPVSA